MARHGGATSRTKRTERRAASATGRTTAKKTATLAATGATNLPLSDRDASWDAGAARKGLSEAQYPRAHFWRDPDGDPKTLAAYKLIFAQNQPPLTAVWRGVTAAAGVVQGARGGVDIPAADVPGVKSRIEAYYRKAAKQYDDPNISPPWGEAAGEKSAAILSQLDLADLGDADPALVLLAYAETGPDAAAFLDRFTSLARFANAAREDGRDATVAALVAAGVPDSSETATTFELTQGSLALRRFYAAALEAGHDETRHASWPCDLELGDHGEVLFRDDKAGVFRLADGTIVYASIAGGWCHVEVAASKRTAAADAVDAFAHAYPALFRAEPDEAVVPITFWTDTRYGPASRMRMIDAASWSTIEQNYPETVRAELAALMNGFEPGKDGQLLLWQGNPGTGKTWALRALAAEWRAWAEFHYVTDPDAFFVHDPAYMVDVLLHETYEEFVVSADGDADVVTSQREGKWKVLILEDTGELLAANAKDEYGQGLSRLLNVVDGMVGQGLRVLAIVTTNDELGDLHPAVTRPGRCASQITFGPFSPEEADRWIMAADYSGEKTMNRDEPATLAELYAEIAAGEQPFADGCAECGHMASDHADGEGECQMDGCGCQQYESSATSAEAENGDGGDATLAAALEPALEPTDPMLVRIGDTVIGRLAWTATPRNVPSTSSQGGQSGRLMFQAIDVPPEHRPRDERPQTQNGPQIEPAPASTTGEIRWTATLCPEGVPTDDGRMFAPGSIKLPGEDGGRDVPLSLMAQLETEEGHDGAVVCGRIDRIWRAGDLILGEGVFDDSEFGREVARMVANGILRGISVDIAIREYDVQPAEPSGEAQDPVDVIFGGNSIFIVTDGVIGAVTIVSFPAFADASISILASGAALRRTMQSGMIVVSLDEHTDALTASAAATPSPRSRPAEWFDNPHLDELTAVVVTDEGRIYGHLAAWGVCHIGIPDVCTTAPASASEYAYFHLGELICDGGERIPVGKITLGGGHADPKLGMQPALAHYDDTGTVAAYVRVGEDDHGIWIAGAIADIDETQLRELRAAPLSGDWRRIGGHLELVAALAVNVPGFPIPRPRALIASADGDQIVLSLVAAGAFDAETVEKRITRVAEMVDDHTREKVEALAASADGLLDEE